MTMHSKQFFRRVRWRGLILALACGLAAGASMAEDVSQCPANTVPIEITNETRKGTEILFSAEKITGAADTFQILRALVTAVTDHVTERLAKDKLCIDSSTGSKERSLLQFVSWPVIYPKDREPAQVPPLDARPTDSCRITSPWIDLAFTRKPVPRIRAIVRWNERQLLADQAVLAGAKNVPPGAAIPFKMDEYNRFENTYKESEIIRQGSPLIEDRIPPDLLWLFRRAAQTDKLPFEIPVGYAWSTVMDKGSERQTRLVFALIDHCFDSDGVNVQYNSILDVADLISLDQYKIPSSRPPAD